MRRTESILIAAAPEVVWPLVADPVMHGDWNPKVVSVGRENAGVVTAGERFEIVARLNDRDRTIRAEVTRVEAPTVVTFLHHRSGEDGASSAEESYTLTPEANGTRLTQTVTIAGLPWWADLIARFLSRLGTPMGPSPLATLRTLAEGDS
jgi:uncharacterized protein YndB with AHSA1/START domain